jgi:hypothetical protein
VWHHRSKEALEVGDIVMFGEPHGPAFLEGSEIGLDGLERRAGLFMPVDERDLDGGAIPVDHQIARVEMLDLVALQDQVPALECGFLRNAMMKK